MEIPAKTLLAEIEAFLRGRPDMSETAFGVASVNDGHLIRDLRDGKDIRMSRVSRVQAFIRANEVVPKRPHRAA